MRKRVKIKVSVNGERRNQLGITCNKVFLFSQGTKRGKNNTWYIYFHSVQTIKHVLCQILPETSRNLFNKQLRHLPINFIQCDSDT